MSNNINFSDFRFDGSKKFVLKKQKTSIDPFYKDKKDYKKQLKATRREIGERQNMMYAHNRFGMLVIFQAMDAAGKDSTIYHTLSGVNPHGLTVTPFKKPSDTELDHDFLWRTNREMPARGQLKVFNRSYYEEVLVVRVHPEILTKYQRIPKALTQDPERVWQQRYEDIRNLESYHHHNGMPVIKFFLNLSKDEQRQRFIDRIDEPDKNWKFAAGDVKERAYWDDYMQAYQDAINATAAEHAPWYVIPADDKLNMRLIVGRIISHHIHELEMRYPQLEADQLAELARFKQQLLDD